MDEKRQQVIDQCRVVAHLAEAILEVYSDKARLFASDSKGPDDIVDLVGEWSHGHMEILGNILNGMDAVVEEDEWTDPIFEKAKTLFPLTPSVETLERDRSSETKGN